MIRRGCTLTIVLFVALFIAYLAFFSRYFEWPGNLIAAGFGSVFGGVGLSSIGHFLYAWRDVRAFGRAARGTPPAHGELAAVAGPIRPIGAPLTSPLRGETCVAYEYEVVSRAPVKRGTTRPCDIAGFAMAAAAIRTAHGDVRLLGFPLLDAFAQEHGGAGAAARAAKYVAATRFEESQGIDALKLVAEFDDALADADGVVRKDFRLTQGAIPFEHRTLAERVVRIDQQVSAVGRYDAVQHALVPRGATLNRLWPGTLAQVRSKVVGAARSQILTGLAFFTVTHAGLGMAFYLSETRYARETPARQADIIRAAIQAGDLAGLELAIRRGADPNARDTFGGHPLFDVRDPAIAAALVRLGADVNTRDPEAGDTVLIRAARTGDTALVTALLAAHADVHAANHLGATALSDATRGGHDDVAALLRAAGAGADPPLEGGPTRRPDRPAPPSPQPDR